MTTIGDITLDGNLTDWSVEDRLDYLPGSQLPGYEIYGQYTGNNFVIALSSNTNQIRVNTTFWLNTDGNKSTGFQIFGFAGGAEYKVEFQNVGGNTVPILYKINAIDGNTDASFTPITLQYSYGNNNQTVEFAIPNITSNNSQGITILADVNDTAFLPSDYSTKPYSISTATRTDFSKKVGIVFSQTTANNFFADKAYTQLFMAMQYQAMQAGVPFDLLTEDDVTDINKIVNYDALIFPSFRNVQLDKLEKTTDTLLDAVYHHNIGIITAGDFLTNDQNNAPIAGDSYIRMKQLLDVTRTGGGGPVTGVLKAEDTSHPVMNGYAANEEIRSYNGIFYNAYGDGLSDGKTPKTLADFEVNGQSNNAVLATETGGRNVHFATEGFLGDNNLVWEALQWAVYGQQPSARLNMSRDASIFISRTDMDQSQEAEDVNPPGDTPGIYDKLLLTLNQWKQDYNFVGSYYLNVGNNPNNSQYTDWTVSKPYYQQILAAGNEIGTHSYTHPADTGLLTPTQLQLEFLASKALIEKQLGLTNIGGAIPGQPEPFSVSNIIKNNATFTKSQLDQFDPADAFNPALGNQLDLVNPTDTLTVSGLPYVTGGYASVGAGYPGAFGLPFPEQDFVYFAPNMSFDFSLVEFRKLTATQAEAEWLKEYTGITNHAAQGIIHFPWHDYGPTNWDTDPGDNLPAPGYTQAMFNTLLARAYNDNTEFATTADVANRIKTFEKTQVFSETIDNTINTTINGSNLGAFSLNVEGTIQNVTNWYAYDNNTVFLDQDGGTFNINLGATQDDVTHIFDLPMRSDLISVSGDGANLDFSFFGAGKVLIDLKNSNGGQLTTTGADATVVTGEILEMTFNTLKQNTAQIRLIVDQPPVVAIPIADVSVSEDATPTTIDLTNVFTDPNNDPIVKTIQLNSNSSLVNASISGNNLTLQYLPNQFGAANITVRGTANGKFVEDIFVVNVAAVDDAPTVANAIADVTVAQNATPTAINLATVFTDVDNDVTAIVKTVQANSNTGLVTASIVNNILTLAYAANQSGTANITVRGTSNGLTVDDTLLVTVSQGDQPPVVAIPITDVSVLEDAVSTTINLANVFTDPDNPSTGIVKTIQLNSNSSLVNASISGNNLTLQYLPNQSGTADITVRGTSNGKFVEDIFVVNVAAVDDAPTVLNRIADVTVNQDAANTTINLANVFTDIDSPVTAIVKTVATNSNSSLVNATISGNTLTLDYLPNQFGTANITVRGTSNGLTVDDTFNLTVNPVGNVINGTNANNDIDGTDRRDIIYGFAGNDKIDSKKGDDLIYGGSGDDEIKTNDGDDVLYGELGNDFLNGENHNDTLYGGEGNDTLLGGNGEDLLNGDAGNDSLEGGDDNDTLYGGTGNDFLDGQNHNDILDGGDNNDYLIGGNNDDALIGGSGNDTLEGQNDLDTLIGVDPYAITPGSNEIDRLTGGSNQDRFMLGSADTLYYSTSGNNDYALITDFSTSQGDTIQLTGSAANYRIGSVPNGLPSGRAIYYGNELIAIVQGTTTLNLTSTAFTYGTYNPQTLVNTINGTLASNNITGLTENEIINGLAGDDILDGKEGNDTLYGGDGIDNLKGDKGDDVVFGDAGNDYVFGGEGNDTLYGSIGNDTIEGNQKFDVLYGGDGNDFLDGKEDGDTLYGGAGNDELIGGGGSGADLLYGEDGNDSLDGGDGIDTLYGGKDNDSLSGDQKNDILIGVDPNDILAGAGERDTLSGGGEGDRFVLGDANQVYYRSQGNTDFALIDDFETSKDDDDDDDDDDFETSKDVIQLKGNASQYRLGATSGTLPTGTGIWLRGSTPAQDELIAIAQFIDPSSLNLNSSAFSFV